MSFTSRSVLIASLLFLTSCAEPRMIMISSEHYSPSAEKLLLDMKSQYLSGKENNQIVFSPTQFNNSIVTTYFFWEEYGHATNIVGDDRIILPEIIDINNTEVTTRENTVEKVIINNIESIYPHDPGWLSKLIDKSEALPTGEHRIQFAGREMFRPGSLPHFNYLYSFLINISFYTDFKISFHYDTKYDIYNTSIWLVK